MNEQFMRLGGFECGSDPFSYVSRGQVPGASTRPRGLPTPPRLPNPPGMSIRPAAVAGMTPLPHPRSLLAVTQRQQAQFPIPVVPETTIGLDTFTNQRKLRVLGNLNKNFQVGHRVRLSKRSEEELEGLFCDIGKCGWNSRMSKYIGRVGMIRRLLSGYLVRVVFFEPEAPFVDGAEVLTVDGATWTMHVAALEPVKEYEFVVGDIVVISNNTDEIRRQNATKEWASNTDLSTLTLKGGRVMEVWSQDVRIWMEADRKELFIAAACLIPVYSANKVEEMRVRPGEFGDPQIRSSQQCLHCTTQQNESPLQFDFRPLINPQVQLGLNSIGTNNNFLPPRIMPSVPTQMNETFMMQRLGSALAPQVAPVSPFQLPMRTHANMVHNLLRDSDIRLSELLGTGQQVAGPSSRAPSVLGIQESMKTTEAATRTVSVREDLERNRMQDPEEPNRCQICFDRKCNVAFQCGHLACDACSAPRRLKNCHLCRVPITSRLSVYL